VPAVTHLYIGWDDKPAQSYSVHDYADAEHISVIVVGEQIAGIDIRHQHGQQELLKRPEVEGALVNNVRWEFYLQVAKTIKRAAGLQQEAK